MENLTKYVLGVAAKSNVEKRQVGCIIVDNCENIIAEGFNTEENATYEETTMHAEVAAIAMFNNSAPGQRGPFKAYVTHAPCPACAKALTTNLISDVIVVDAFMKFDGDKTRFDLVDGNFAATAMLSVDSWNTTIVPLKLKGHLFGIAEHGAPPEEGAICYVSKAIQELACAYVDFFEFEEAIAKVLTFGARKYKANNWKKCMDTGRYLAAAHRHLNAVIRGEMVDEETGLSHYDHLACNLMFLYVLGLKY